MPTATTHSRIDGLKMKHQKTYSEDLFGIPHAPEHQCPEIDKVVKAVSWVERNATRKTDRMEEDELRSHLDDIEREMWGMESNVEEIRKACESIREWGQAWKDLFKQVVNDSEIDIEDYI